MLHMLQNMRKDDEVEGLVIVGDMIAVELFQFDEAGDLAPANRLNTASEMSIACS